MADSDTGTVKRRGRPKGSKNKPKPKKTGRPKGRKSSYTVSEKALAQRREQAEKIKTILLPNNEEEKNFNSLLIEHIMAINEIAKNADRHDLNTLKSCFVSYLQLCYKNGMPIQNQAAYASMGFTFKDWTIWVQRGDESRKELANMVRMTCALSREGQIDAGKLNPVIGIFWQRNFDGLRNDTEQVQALQEQDEDYNSGSKSYKEKYKKLIGE